jgi:hypothetical protein
MGCRVPFLLMGLLFFKTRLIFCQLNVINYLATLFFIYELTN